MKLFQKKISALLGGGFFLLLSFLVLFPVIYTFSNSFMSPEEVSRYYMGTIGNGNAEAVLHVVPDLFSLESYYEILLHSPDYLVKFWSSLFLCSVIVLGQLVISCMGGFAFAKYPLPCKRILLFVLILLMIMPVQVTLVPNYIVLDSLHLIDSWAALALPMSFAPFGTVLMTQIIRGIPNELLDAAKLDGASVLNILVRVIVPSGKGGVVSLLLLSFVDAWNMVEQPVVFLRDTAAYPLSVFLASVNSRNFPLSFACGMLAALPVLLLFLFFHEELAEGIEFSGIK